MEQIALVDEKGAADIGRFYDKLSADYDSMTSFESRCIREKPFLSLFVSRYKVRTALDAGAGTGVHSILMAQQGVEVTAVDISRKMLEKVKEHAQRMHLHIKTVKSGFQEMADHIRGTFDAVLCTGNSLPHITTRHELDKTFKGFFNLLNPEGVLFIQQLNYDRILATKEHVQSVKESGNATFVRYYEYHHDAILFNILKLTKGETGVKHSLESVMLRPILKEELEEALRHAGFVDITFFGNITLEAFHPRSSKDIVVLARKPN